MNLPGRAQLKSLAIRALATPALVKRQLRTIERHGWVTILNLHRVSDEQGSAYEPLQPALFGELLEFACRHFRPTTFGELADTLTRPGKPPIILSFDDGYRDFHDVAVPMAESFGVRLNQNIIPACIESGLPPLNVMAQDFVGQASEKALLDLKVPKLDQKVDRLDRAAWAIQLSRHLKSRPRSDQEDMARTLVPQFQASSRFRPTPMMTLEQVRSVAQRHEIGAHSFEHASMAHESPTYFAADVQRCATYLRHELGLAMNVYAFPNGSCTPSQIADLHAHGVAHALLVGEQLCTGSNGIHHRLTFHAHSTQEVRFRASGAWFAATGGRH